MSAKVREEAGVVTDLGLPKKPLRIGVSIVSNSPPLPGMSPKTLTILSSY